MKRPKNNEKVLDFIKKSLSKSQYNSLTILEKSILMHIFSNPKNRKQTKNK